ncbi:MAG: hypothetical protein BHW58_06810 [Azospirillum sp. 51_20]|nr:MAG: hypothetical protein BHW58_06810 [Azospirillum sp. 51_20]
MPFRPRIRRKSGIVSEASVFSPEAVLFSSFAVFSFVIIVTTNTKPLKKQADCLNYTGGGKRTPDKSGRSRQILPPPHKKLDSIKKLMYSLSRIFILL